jgi:hypothetical protein
MKKNKNEVEYGPGMKKSHCGPWAVDDPDYCQHFIAGQRLYQPGECELVAGSIRPAMWCKLFKKVK